MIQPFRKLNSSQVFRTDSLTSEYQTSFARPVAIANLSRRRFNPFKSTSNLHSQATKRRCDKPNTNDGQLSPY